MTERTTETTQRIAARIAGWTLLLLMASGFTGMFAFGGNPIVDGDAAASAQNILAHERAFRGSLACEIVMLNCDVVLALVLYALLKPVNGTLALLGSFWRIANAVVLGVGVAASLVALDLFSNPNYMSLLNGSQLHPIALLFFDLHDRLSLMGLMFFCLGAGVHSWLLYRSRYIPRMISGLYLFACVEMLLCCFTFLIFPKIREVLDPAFVVPDALAELSAALWLAIKGVKLPTVAKDASSELVR
ncbi:DUF4386 domain-containing protein [Tunturiibacter psychrotolerans]|jgi:hypothetical protein|uniref:DUF4386 domain-containing protein n=1 Tax=Tunturiibacter psychrotolerans TaxID=3069686 RepID=UPI003D19DC13